jgi:hypothetical protein
MKKDQISWKDSVSKINKHIERNKRRNPLIESYNEDAHKYNEKVEDEVIKLIKDKYGNGLSETDIYFGNIPADLELEHIKEGFYHGGEIERIRLKGDNTVKYKKLKKYRYPNIVGLYNDERYPSHYRQLSLMDGEGGFAQDPRKCFIRLVCDVSEDGRQPELMYNGLEWRLTDWNKTITVPPEKIKVQIPFAAVTKDNFDTYLNTIKRIPKEKLDASDAYTRRIAKLMGIDLKRPVIETTQPTTKDDIIKEAIEDKKIVEENISRNSRAGFNNSSNNNRVNDKPVVEEPSKIITSQKGSSKGIKEPVINTKRSLNNLAKAGLITAGVAGLGLGGYYLYKKNKMKKKE